VQCCSLLCGANVEEAGEGWADGDIIHSSAQQRSVCALRPARSALLGPNRLLRGGCQCRSGDRLPSSKTHLGFVIFPSCTDMSLLLTRWGGVVLCSGKLPLPFHAESIRPFLANHQR
jgi:hypothetical protein